MQVSAELETIKALGARVVLVAYDEPSLIEAKMARGVDVPFPVVLDRDKTTYANWGMGRARLTQAMLSPKLTLRYLSLLMRGEPFLGFAPDMLQLGGDFIVTPKGVISYLHRMRDNGDRASVADLLTALRQAGTT